VDSLSTHPVCDKGIMSKHNKISRKKKQTPGPKPEVVKINGNWRDAVKRSLEKKKPANGWPRE